jgi:hypothetical protein
LLINVRYLNIRVPRASRFPIGNLLQSRVRAHNIFVSA